MRLNGRREIMAYLGRRGRATRFRYKGLGVPVFYQRATSRAVSFTELLDEWSLGVSRGVSEIPKLLKQLFKPDARGPG